MPLYVQGVLGTGALVAGFTLAGLTLGWPIAASLAGRLYLRLGFRSTALIGTGSRSSAAGCCSDLAEHVGVADRSSPASSSGSAWASSPARRWWRRRARSSGRTGASSPARRCSPGPWAAPLGIAVFGAIANAALAGRLAGTEATTAADIPPADLDNALELVFTGVGVTALVMVVAVLLMPRGDRPDDPTAH